MEIRTIQKTGGSSYTLTLPKQWVIQNGLDQNVEVEVLTKSPSQLLLQPVKSKSKTSFTLDLQSVNPEALVREIVGLYIAGFDDIHLVCQNIVNQQRNLIRSTVHKLIGFELYEESAQSIYLKNISSGQINSQDYIEKMYVVSKNMFLDSILALKNRDILLANDIIQRDDVIDRMHLAISRQYNLSLRSYAVSEDSNQDPITLHFHTVAGIRLERLADHIVKISELVCSLKNKLPNLTVSEKKLIKDINQKLLHFDNLLTNPTKVQAHAVLDTPRCFCTNPYTSSSVTNSLKRIRSYLDNIAEETINYLCVLSTN